jgi:predicted ATP-dependent serine protease
VFRVFKEHGIAIRRGEVTMIAGIPGAGKSTLALAISLRSRVPTLYVCADTNAHTIATRLYSMVVGVSQRDAEIVMENAPEQAKDRLKDTRNIFWCFDSSIELDTIDEELKAFEELRGEPPHLMIVDNLIDLTGGVVETAAAQEALQALKLFARENNTAVVVLHHTKEGYPGNPCQPMSAVQGMVNQTPALILTVGQAAGNMFGVAAVKNRYGKSDNAGAHPAWLEFSGEYMYMADLPEGR